ncbi:hypothetical protein BV98_003141 [Sphingobium herbicidovorans NBRC 16415]|uniref:Uncharacterized protein n=1 Tax=Sphingobium herbicidovorans (strain ATCC 700291 / DSM 11019 / CCUG 56400 / KCTC 2939 / LMG 18315 / NBRC 16415 / MH) TaxID=1219045 RepID=A0A086P6Q7_SPHHM|nr:hypothetical protein [Sphingobium herbicidovorans]KFG89075.1 hypothetical protein BV98_003141 [Sphingobium herbicidovorans NBRC 16415]
MALINPAKNTVPLIARLKAEDDPIRRRNLLNMIDHSRAELALNFDATLAGLSENAQHRSYNSNDPEQNPKGKVEIRRYYERLRDLNLLRIECETDRLVVDRHCVFREGPLRIAYPGKVLAMMGIAVDQEDADYLFEARIATLWPYDDDGLCLGEHSYMAGDGFDAIADRKLRWEDILPADPYLPVTQDLAWAYQ